MTPSWPHLAQVDPKLVPRWPQVGPCWLMLVPSWLHDGPSPKVSPRLAKASTKALPLRPGFSKMSTKALPQAFRRLIVRSGCSILLLSILKVVSFWCFFQLALSWQVFQNDLFKRSSQVVLVGSCILKFHLFSCIARRHSSKYIMKYIQQKQQQQHLCLTVMLQSSMLTKPWQLAC